MAKKLRVGILFGGRSGEHEVSLMSAASVLKAIDRKRFEVVPIGITRDGRWVGGEEAQRVLEGQDLATPRLPAAADTTTATRKKKSPGGLTLTQATGVAGKPLDVIFPVLHGTFGEDGTVQGLFELTGAAYVGSGVLGSAAGMDKDVMKRLFRAAGLPTVPHVAVLRSSWQANPKKIVGLVEKTLKYPLFVKPANLGSSVGISKVHNRAELAPALNEAAKYDRKLIVEEGVGSGTRAANGKPRELEVGVLGNDDPKASVVGEVVPIKEFYDYEAKYLSDGSKLILPAKLTRAEEKTIRAMAVEAFKACELAGLARVDFLMEPGGKRRIYLNEVNTLPGFTSISMYPKLWGATGVGYTELITRLIELAIERRAEKDATSFLRLE